MDTLEQNEDKYIIAPSWCAEMSEIIDLEVLAEELGIPFAQALREALDQYIELPEIQEILLTP